MSYLRVVSMPLKRNATGIERKRYCGDHSGVCTDMENVKESVRELWKAVNTIKRNSTVTMTSILIALGMFVLNMIIPFHKG
jgi:hypothetical protein